MKSDNRDPRPWDRKPEENRYNRDQWQGIDPARRPYPGQEYPPFENEPSREESNQNKPGKKGFAAKSFLLGMAAALAVFIIVLTGILLYHNYGNPSGKTGKSKAKSAKAKANADKKGKTFITVDDYSKREEKYDQDGNMIKSTRWSLEGSFKGWTDYTYDDQGSEIKYVSYYGNGKVQYSGETEQDAQGNITRWSYYDADHEIEDYRVAELDSEGNAVKWNYFKADDSPDGYSEIEYDSKGIKKQETRFSQNGNKRSCTWYDDRENELRYESYDEDGQIYYWSEYEYNDQGVMTRCESEWPGDSYFSKRIEEYDDKGWLVKSVSYNGDDVDEISVCEYDDKACLIKKTNYHFDNTVENVESYEYDDQGHRTKGEKAIDDGTVYEKTVYEFKNDFISKETERNSKDVLEKYIEYDEYGYTHVYASYYEGEISYYEVTDNSPECFTLKKTIYYDEGNHVKSVSEYEPYEYDNGFSTASGTKEKKETLYTESGEVDAYYLYKYNDKYQEIAKEKYDTQDKLFEREESEYNSEGVKVKTTTYDASGKVLSAQETLYDKKGRYAGYVSYGENGKLQGRTENENDDHGNTVKRTHYNENNEVSDWTVSEFDKYDNEIKETWYNKDGSVSSWSQYEYDSAGHKRKKTSKSSYSDSMTVTDYDVDEDEILEPLF